MSTNKSLEEIRQQKAVLENLARRIETLPGSMSGQPGWDFHLEHTGLIVGKPAILSFEIFWGDWKHAHKWFDHKVRQFLTSEGYDVQIVEVVTQEDGSDCYSAIHYINLQKKGGAAL